MKMEKQPLPEGTVGEIGYVILQFFQAENLKTVTKRKLARYIEIQGGAARKLLKHYLKDANQEPNPEKKEEMEKAITDMQAMADACGREDFVDEVWKYICTFFGFSADTESITPDYRLVPNSSEHN